MTNLLQRQIASLPPNAGVYKFYSGARLLYVGKAKSLRARVRSYFRDQADLSPAKQEMVKQIDRLEILKVSNETEALFWEANLIKQYRPPYNVVFKDDKSWLYLAIDYRQEYPPVSLERRANLKGIKYFGPYPSAATVRRTFQLLKKILGLKTCPNSPAHPCLAAAWGRCLGHNLTPQSQQIYWRNLKYLTKILRGQSQAVINNLKQQMATAVKQKKFETAVKQRDQIKSLQQIIIKQNAISSPPQNFDALGLERAVGLAAICRLPIRRGILLDAENFLLEHSRGLNDDEIWNDFLAQYYQEVAEAPPRAYLALNPALKEINGVNFKTAARGQKYQLIKLAENTAQNFLKQSAASQKHQEIRANKGLVALQQNLHLPGRPRRIEGYDVSNIQGQAAVGAMAVLTHGLPDAKSYRHFKIQGLTKPNDVAMLAQVITRRFTKNHNWPKPDLIVLDGGAGQLSTAKKILDSYGVKIPLIALAKKEELIYLPNKKVPLRLAADNPGLLLLEQLRDEAHRFGITFYRSLHRHRQVKSAWDELPGVGPKTKKLLKQGFGDLKNLRLASLDKLEKILGKKKAVKLFPHLKQV